MSPSSDASAAADTMAASEVGIDGRPPMATELYAAGRVIGNKCFDENLDCTRRAA